MFLLNDCIFILTIEKTYVVLAVCSCKGTAMSNCWYMMLNPKCIVFFFDSPTYYRNFVLFMIFKFRISIVTCMYIKRKENFNFTTTYQYTYGQVRFIYILCLE